MVLEVHADMALPLGVMPEAAQEAQLNKTCSAFSKSDCKVIPEFLKTQKHLCEIKRVANNCEKFEKEKPALRRFFL